METFTPSARPDAAELGLTPVADDLVVRPSTAAILAGVSVKTAYQWLRRGLLIDRKPPGRVAGVYVQDVARLIGRAPFTWSEVAHATIVAARKYERAETRRYARQMT